MFLYVDKKNVNLAQQSCTGLENLKLGEKNATNPEKRGIF